MTKQGPGAAAFLLLAEGHLVKAREIEASKAGPAHSPAAWLVIRGAIDCTRHALDLLKQEREE